MGIWQNVISFLRYYFFERFRGKMSSFFSWLNNYVNSGLSQSRRNLAKPVPLIIKSNVDPSLLKTLLISSPDLYSAEETISEACGPGFPYSSSHRKYENFSIGLSSVGEEDENENKMIVKSVRVKLSDEHFEYENFLRWVQSIGLEFESSSGTGGDKDDDIEETRLIYSPGFGSSEETSVSGDGIIDLEAQENVPCFEQSSEKNKKKKKKKNVRAGSEAIRWIKHYSSQHRILVVGEGDFSFSASLAMAFYRASNMIATSLDSQEFLKSNYRRAQSNIEKLKSRQCKVMHGIDATKIAIHKSLRHVRFDRIIFNFPFAGFFKNLSRESQLKQHRRLVSLFLKNAKEMISENGEIHISHKTNGFHSEWMIESIAYSYRLRLIEAVEFDLSDYPGYNTKYGFGGDNNFNCCPSKTYKFGLKIVTS